MKRIIGSSIILAAIALATSALAAAFTPGNLVIYRVGGDASGNTLGTLSNTGAVVWLDEYSTNGVFQTSHMMPTNYFGANSPLIANGTAFGNGLITTSVDGRFILVAGFSATLGQLSTSLSSSFATVVPRVIGVVGGNGNIDTTTTLTNNASGGSNGGEIRSIVSPDGTNFWTGGDALSAGGVQYTSRTSDGDAITFNALNTRQLQIFNNQIYLGSASLIGNHIAQVLNTNNVNTLPTATNDVATLAVVGTTNPPSPWAFIAFKLNAGGSDPIDTLYVADGSNFVWKVSKVAGTWVNDGSIRAGSAVGLAGQIRASTLPGATNVDLWITGGGGTLSGNDNLYAFTDTTGYHGGASGNANLNIIKTSANSTSFRGLAFAPVGGDGTLSGSGNISVGPLVGLFANGDTGCALSSSSATQTYSIANLGTTGPVNWQATCDDNWVSFSPSSGSLPSGGSVTVSAFFNNNVISLPGSLDGVTNTTTIRFTNTTSNVGTTARAVRLIQRDQDLTPSTDFTVNGPFGGPFSPTNKTYTIFNGSNNITLAISKTASWLDLSDTSVSLAGCARTSITVSVNASATNLATGNYSDTISFSNQTGAYLIDSRAVNLTVGGVYFCDDFSTFTQNANIEGQQGWVNLNANPSIGVSNNAVWQPASTTAVDEPWKNIPVTTNGNIYQAMVIVVDSAQPVGTANPLRMTCFFLSQNESGFAVDYLTARDTGTGTFVFGIRKNGAGNNTAFGTTAFNYGSTNKVIVQADVSTADAFMALYVNPVGAPSDNNTNGAYVGTVNAGAIDSGVASISLQGQFTSGAASPGYHVYKLCVTTSGSGAYNDLQSFGPIPDPFTTWQNQYFGTTNGNALAGADPDGDGMINTNEFLAGFDPTNNTASVRVLNVAKSGSDITVTYRGANGNSTTTPPIASRTNVLEATTGTGNGSYSNNFASTGQTNVLSGGTGLGTITTFTDVGGASGATKYYRVRVLVP